MNPGRFKPGAVRAQPPAKRCLGSDCRRGVELFAQLAWRREVEITSCNLAVDRTHVVAHVGALSRHPHAPGDLYGWGVNAATGWDTVYLEWSYVESGRQTN